MPKGYVALPDMEQVKRDMLAAHDTLLPELNEVVVTFCAAMSRLRDKGTDDSSLTDDVYEGAVRSQAWRAIETARSQVATPADRQKALIDLATMAIRWARKMRLECQS